MAGRGGHYELTALGQVLLDRTSTAYDVLESLLSSQSSFDPVEEQRELRLLASDYAGAVSGAELIRVVHETAPGIRLRLTQTPPNVVEDTGALLSAADGLLMPRLHTEIGDIPPHDHEGPTTYAQHQPQPAAAGANV